MVILLLNRPYHGEIARRREQAFSKGNWTCWPSIHTSSQRSLSRLMSTLCWLACGVGLPQQTVLSQPCKTLCTTWKIWQKLQYLVFRKNKCGRKQIKGLLLGHTSVPNKKCSSLDVNERLAIPCSRSQTCNLIALLLCMGYIKSRLNGYCLLHDNIYCIMLIISIAIHNQRR